MDFDVQSQCSDEGVELSVAEYGDTSPADFTYNNQETQPDFLEAKVVYLLLPENIPISRAARLQWLLDHLNMTITVPSLKNFDKLEVISAIPREQNLTAKYNRFLITYRTELKFIAHSYRFVYCLDMSPSQSNVDVYKGEVLFDEVLRCFKNSIEGLSRQFTVPGNSLVFQPCIYVTIMVNTPFFITPAQQVILQGIKTTPKNVQDIIKCVETHFLMLEGKIAEVCSSALTEIDRSRAIYEGIVGDLFDIPDSRKMPKIPMVTPDTNFVNMLRYSMLAISLLPDNTLSHILVITDGIVAMPDSNVMETLLFQLHYDAISVSFLKLGCTFHPNSSAGFVSYIDLLYFFSRTTLGACLEYFPKVVHERSLPMNVYQEIFLVWSFHNKKHAILKNCDMNPGNDSFYSRKLPNLLSKRQTEESTTSSILLLLSRRMREGFTVDNIFYMNNNLEIKLVLQWKASIFIHYNLSSTWPTQKNLTRYEVHVSAPYEFLHDMTCMIKKEIKSTYRALITQRFWNRLCQLSSGDLNLATQLSNFQLNKDWFTVPESVKSGVPVFSTSNATFSDFTRLILTPRDASSPKFTNMWQGISQMETSNWRKWFHVHKISLILRHDVPLPKHLHMANSSQRYQVVQCRQAITALYGMLGTWASFVLIDNHTYLKLLLVDSDKPPFGFCIVRVSSKFPCAVLNLGFSTNTSGYVRQNVCDDLKSELASLCYLPSSHKATGTPCCVLLQKPLEKILIRYERIPSNYTTVIFPDGTQPPQSQNDFLSPVRGSLFTTLSRYLFHKRWIWSATYYQNSKLLDVSISRILNILTRMRLKEGYSFAHSASGIVTMVLELKLEPNASLVVQYVLFPPHCALGDDYYSESEEEFDPQTDRLTEVGDEMQMITEVWIEPHYGQVVTNNSRSSYVNKRNYYQIADAISRVDFHCINVLLTMEHMSQMCQNKDSTLSRTAKVSTIRRDLSRKTGNKIRFLDSEGNFEEKSPWYPIITPRIEHIPFKFDPIRLLPVCPQTELLFSMLKPEKSVLKECKPDKANKILLESIFDHFGLLHDQELDLTKDDSKQFTKEVLARHKHKFPHTCPIDRNVNLNSNIQWKCFLRGVSVTHVILTFIPASVEDLRTLLGCESAIPASFDNESFDRASSRGSNFSDVPLNLSNSISLPVYVYDCPLKLIVDSYVEEEHSSPLDDAYEDYRFKSTNVIQEDCVRLKNCDANDNSGEENIAGPIDIRNVKEHCKALVLTHSKCFSLSLFVALHTGVFVHNSDVQSAMDLCDEEIVEIDITNYISNICAHLKQNKEERISISHLNEAYPCNEVRALHMLIKDKFYKIVGNSFCRISSNGEFYYFKQLLNKTEETLNDSDDDMSLSSSNIEFRSERELSIFSEGPHLLQGLETAFDELPERMSEISPLFLHLICTLKYNHGGNSNTSIRVIPTCLGELIQNLEPGVESLDRKSLQVTLDILCLTLPPGIQNVITEYSNQSLRTTSFCSDGVQRSISTNSDNSVYSEYPEPEPPTNLTDFQKKSIDDLCDEVKWLLEDEICATLLDCENVDKETFNFVTKHVVDGHPHRISCRLDQINLNFVYANCQSQERFLEEFKKMDLPLGYILVQKGDYYYFTKDPTFVELTFPSSSPNPRQNLTNEFPLEITELFRSTSKLNASSLKEDAKSQQSDITSDNGSVVGTDGGYDEDVSEDDDNYDWLVNLSNKRPHLPNFWLIMRVEQKVVTVYFHCRFLELPVTLVDRYLEVEQSVCDSVRDLCKRVNQLLLLQSLYDTKICDIVLEPDDSNCHHENGSLSRNPSYNKLKHQDDSSDDSDLAVCQSSMSEASTNFKPGYFSCPVVWEKHFVLHPRLKSGSGGKTGTSRGILALKNVLDKFSVLNRHNMFVYRDNKEGNVFYLRLFENVNIIPRMAVRGVESETALVSRSPSINSLPLGHKPSLTQSDQSIVSLISSEVRPRVRSFGERESRSFIEKDKDRDNENTLILRVHGIATAGTDVQCDLVQVLQNRLDDAVLDFLSVMLARNAMCPLTPEDVHFIQKPFKQAEHIIRLTVQSFAIQWLKANAFIHYLKQNLLQFLNVPKYTDNRSEYHFKDYSDGDTCLCNDGNIFIYNQSQTSSGARGIACIALALKKSDNTESVDLDAVFENIFRKKEYDISVYSDVIEEESKLPDNYLEFRLWKQGRVNIDNLSKKLKSAVSQATWDIVMEYYLLRKPLCVEECKTGSPIQQTKFRIDSLNHDFQNELEFKCSIDLNLEKTHIRAGVKKSQRLKVDGRFFPSKKYRRVNPSLKASRVLSLDNEHENSTENNDENNVLSIVYSKYLTSWLEFGFSINTPSVKKHKINLINGHIPCLVVKELVRMLEDQPRAFPAVPSSCLSSQNEDVYIPFVLSNFIQKYVIISRGFQKNLLHYDEEHDIPAHLDCKNLKHSQKFVPIVIHNVFVPRQKIFWISVENDAIVIFTYNWAKENIDKLINNCANLGQWLCVRSCFLKSATSQKLGLFHNQPLTRKCFMLATNSYYSLIGSLDAMSKFPRDHLHKKSHLPSFNLITILEAFRDNFCNTKYSSFDPVIVFTIEMREMKTLEKRYRDEMKKLHSMYQSRTGTTSVPQLNLLMQNSRILHYCHTPLLFLPRWRIKCASTRDHSLYPSMAIELADRLADKEKEIWHTDLCYAFFCEYRNYLHTLGFTPLQIDCPQGPVGVWTKDKSSYDSIFYIQRTILGGIIIFTASFSEPFFVTKMYAIECNRLQNISSRTSVNGFTLSFLDECDKVKILMHLHSFTYDYHLRSISNYISGNPGKLCEKYNVYQFLDHFLKYYNKAPNFARNLVHTDSLTIENLLTEGQQLYDFLLQNVYQYGFSVLEIEEGGSDLVLVKTSTSHRVSYKDSQDRECIDDFNVTLVVYNVCYPFKSTDNVLHLIYYLILTSKRETFPTYEIENKLGKFRTVSCSFKSSAALERATSELESSLPKSDVTKDEMAEQSSLQDSTDAQSSKSTSEEQTVVDVLPTVPIYQESVNYLGYYSSHEQLMQQLILEKAKVTQNEIRDMVSTGMIHCRTNLLWDRLTSNNSPLTFDEFIELKNLSNLKHLGNLYPNLGSLLNQTLHWYQGLAKLLLVKYAEYNRQFTSADGNIVYYAILHKTYYGAFMLLSLDCHTSRGDLYIVYREPKKIDDIDKLDYFYQKALCDGFVNCICFYLWSGMISS